MGLKPFLLIAVVLAIFVSNTLCAGTILSRSFSCKYNTHKYISVSMGSKHNIDPTYSKYYWLACSYVGGQIYCFGGDVSYSLTSNFEIDTNIYSLNIAQFAGKETETINSQWNTITPGNVFDPEPRRTPTAIALSDGKTFFVQGGQNTLPKKFVNKTIAFDTSTSRWINRQSYTEGNSGTRQMYKFYIVYLLILINLLSSFAFCSYSSTAVNLPNSMVGFYGGLEQLVESLFSILFIWHYPYLDLQTLLWP